MYTDVIEYQQTETGLLLEELSTKLPQLQLLVKDVGGSSEDSSSTQNTGAGEKYRHLGPYEV